MQTKIYRILMYDDDLFHAYAYGVKNINCQVISFFVFFMGWDVFCVLGVKDVYIGRNDLWLAANFSKPYGVSEHLKRTLTGNNSSAYSLCIQQQNISLFQVPWMLEFVGVFLSRDHNVLNGNELHFSL